MNLVLSQEEGEPDQATSDLSVILVDRSGRWWKPVWEDRGDGRRTVWHRVPDSQMPFFSVSNNSVSTDTPINKTLTAAGTAEDLVSVPATLVGRKLSIVNRGPGDLAIAFDRTATATDTLVKQGEGYSEDDLAIGTKVSFINVTAGKKPNVTGVMWSG